MQPTPESWENDAATIASAHAKRQQEFARSLSEGFCVVVSD
jgi:hypothetical protein